MTAVREFNRFYTGVIGLLREGLLDTPYSLTEARVLFELAREDAVEVAHLRRWLDIDAGYLSRLLARFEADRLVTRTRSAADGRRQVIGLTAAGRAVSAKLDSRSGDQIRALLTALTRDGRQRLTGAMAGIREIIEPAPGRPRSCSGSPHPVNWAGSCSGTAPCTPPSTGGMPPSRRWCARIVADFAARDVRRQGIRLDRRTGR